MAWLTAVAFCVCEMAGVKITTLNLSVAWGGGVAAILQSTLITDRMLAWALGRNSEDGGMMVIGGGSRLKGSVLVIIIIIIIIIGCSSIELSDRFIVFQHDRRVYSFT